MKGSRTQIAVTSVKNKIRMKDPTLVTEIWFSRILILVAHPRMHIAKEKHIASAFVHDPGHTSLN
jgi:hypothetical protein